MPCPHGQSSTPASCSQCIGAVPRVVRSDERGVTIDGVKVRAGILEAGIVEPVTVAPRSDSAPSEPGKVVALVGAAEPAHRTADEAAPQPIARVEGIRAGDRLMGPEPEPEPMTFLTNKEIERIVMAVAVGMGEFTDDDVERAVRWAERVRIESAVLDLVMDGKLAMAMLHVKSTRPTRPRRRAAAWWARNGRPDTRRRHDRARRAQGRARRR